jgi:hypothetical protein
VRLDFGPALPASAAGTASAERGTPSCSAWRTAGWVTAGVGGSALPASGIAGLFAWNELGDFDCSSDPCVAADPAALDSYDTLRTL